MKIKHMALSCSLLALSFTGFAHAQDIKSQITTQYVGTQTTYPVILHHNKKHKCHHKCHHKHMFKDSFITPIPNAKSGVILHGSTFVPNYSSVITNKIIDQGVAGWDYLGQHKIGYTISIVESKTPYYYSYKNLINSIADNDKTSLGSNIDGDMVIINDSPKNIVNGIKKYTKDKKISAQKVLGVESWTGENIVYGKKTMTFDEKSSKKIEKFFVNNSSLTLSGNVYGQNYLDMNIELKNETGDINSLNKDIQRIGSRIEKESVNFHTHIKSGSTFIYQLPPEKKHEKTLYILITPEVFPVTN
mgnify:CR=1 FL=1